MNLGWWGTESLSVGRSILSKRDETGAVMSTVNGARVIGPWAEGGEGARGN